MLAVALTVYQLGIIGNTCNESESCVGGWVVMLIPNDMRERMQGIKIRNFKILKESLKLQIFIMHQSCYNFSLVWFK